jgi:hypothetical protein
VPPLEGLLIDEPIVLDVSEPVRPEILDDDQVQFDFSAVDFVSDGRVNDFEFWYQAKIFQDVDLFAYNHRTGKWDMLVQDHLVGGYVPRRKSLVFSSQVSDARDYLDEFQHMRIKGFSTCEIELTSISALQMNPKYDPMPVSKCPGLFPYYAGLHYHDGRFFFPHTDIDIWDAEGVTVGRIPTPMGWSAAVAVTRDGAVWINGPVNHVADIHELDSNGNVLRGFSLNGAFCYSMTAHDDRLWLLTTRKGEDFAVEVDVAASVASNSLVAAQRFSSLGYSKEAIAFDGNQVFLYRRENHRKAAIDVFRGDGTFVRSYDVNIQSPAGMSWDNGSLWILHGGPLRLNNSGYLVSNFVLPH